MRCVLAALVALSAACGTTDDQRPLSLENVTMSVLSPNCGNAQCHSQFRRAEDYAFDTVDEARSTFATYPGLVIPGASSESLLYQVLVSPGGDGNFPRMPYDQPLPDADVLFIQHWIDEGAEGLVP